MRELRYLVLILMLVFMTAFVIKNDPNHGLDIVLIIAAIGATFGVVFHYFTSRPIRDRNG